MYHYLIKNVYMTANENKINYRNIQGVRTLTSSDLSIIHILENLRKNFISSYVEKNYSPEEIIVELKKLKLDYSRVGELGIQDTVRNGLHMKWNKDKKQWEEQTQASSLGNFTEEDEKRFWSSYLANLSPNQAETLLKDMKDILSNVKQITKAAERITRDIDYIVAKVKQYEGDK
jgi:hypothetical protein